MINLYSLNACTNGLKLLKQHNLRLNPDVDSPIAVLNKATNQQSVMDSSITDEQFYQELPNITALKQPARGNDESAVIADGAAGTTVLNVEDHEPTLYELQRMAIGQCQGLLDFSRNVIQPFVQLVVQNNDIRPEEGVKEDWALVPVDLDPAINEPVVQALIGQLDNPTGAGFTHERIPARVPDVVDIPETGKATYDKLVARLLSELGWSMSEALRVMVEPMTVVPNSDQAPKYVKQNILFLLLSAYYIDNPWPNSDLSSDKWKTQFTRLHYTLVGWVYLYAEAIVTRVKMGNIVFSYDADTKQVFICQEAMDKYLEQQGTVEALLGAVYTMDDGKAGSTQMDKLLADQDAYTRAWADRSSVRRMEADTDWLRTNRASLKTAFGLAIDQLDPGLLGAGADGQLTPMQAKTAVNSAIDHLFTRGTTDVTEFIIRTACGEVFAEYDASSLLLSIHHGMIKGVKPEESANDWIINYVLDWMLTGILVEK